MALNIKNPHAYRLARELAEATGESMARAVTVAIEERLAAVRRQRDPSHVRDEVARLQAFVHGLPDRDTRTADEILGYDQHGLPG